MGRSIWTIAIFGFIATLSLVIAFLFVFKRFGDSPLSSSTKVAIAVREEFHFDVVGSTTSTEPQKTALILRYDTHLDSKFNLEAQHLEMKAVALFAAGKLEPIDRRKTDEIRVRRTEIRGSGCWQRTYVTDLTVPNLLKGIVGPPPPGLPQPPK